jgi:hypothetical protein
VQCPQRFALFVEYVNTDHRRAGFRRGIQASMIGEPKIVAKPDDAGRNRFAGHQVVNSFGAH